MILDEDDISIPEPGLPLEFKRYYRSGQENGGTLGPKWRHTYEWRIWATNTYFGAVTNQWLVLQTPDDYHWKAVSVAGGGHEIPHGGLFWDYTQASNGAYRVAVRGGNIYEFGTNGMLNRIQDHFNNAITLNYSNTATGLQLTDATHSSGHSLAFQYISNLLSGVSSPVTNLGMNFTYATNGVLTNATVSVGESILATSYTYDPETLSLTKRINAIGIERMWDYDGIRATNSYIGTNLWNQTTVAYDTNTPGVVTVTEVQANTSSVYRYEYDPLFQKMSAVYGPNYSGSPNWIGKRYTHDDWGNFTLVEHADGDPSSPTWSQTAMTYDSANRMTNWSFGYLTTPASTWMFNWNTNGDTLASITDPEGMKTEWDYINGAVSVARLFPATNQPVETLFTYTTNGLLASVTNANGHWEACQYNSSGQPTQTFSQVGMTNWMSWDNLGHLNEIRLPSSTYTTNELSEMVPRVITFEPNELGWVRKITRPDGRFETFAFDGIGNVTSLVDVAGRTNNFTWLPTRKLASTTRFLTGATNQSVTVGMDYDQQMNVVKVSDELGRAVETYQLDLQDRPVKVTNVESQELTVAYGLGNMIRQINRFDGTTTSFSYDEGGRVKEVSYPSSTIGFRYLKNDLLMTASNNFGVISNAYDGANRLISTRTSGLLPQPATVSYQLDAVGNPTNTQASGIGYTVNRTFDAGERLSSLAAGNVGATFNYNVINGLLETVNYTNGMVCSYGFDDLDRLTSMTWRDASNNVLRSRSYSYTLAGMISRVDMESGEKMEYSYDSLDRLTAEKRTDPFGQTLAWDIYEYDLAGNRTKKTILNASGSTLLTVNYAVATGNRLASWNVPETNRMAKFPVVGAASEVIGTNDRFGYLWVSNATSGGMAVKPEVNGTNFWTYDFTVGVGTQKIVAAIRDTAGNMGYTTNTIISTVMTNGAYQYSAAGCLTNMVIQGKGTTKTLGLTWDGQYQLTVASTNSSTNGVVESYKYDAMGRRVMTASAGVTNWHVYDGPHVIADLDGTGAKVRSYVWGPGVDNLLAMTVYGGTTNTYYAFKDHLNSVLALTDSFGQIVEQYRYDAWGRTTVFDGNGNLLSTSAVGNRYCWQGREYSWKTCLYNFRARWYEPITGRWLANDPIGISGGLNQYVFCANNPVNFVDPSGLWRFSFGGGWGVAARASIGRNSYTGRWDINFVLGVGAGGSGSFRFNRDDPEECGHADRGASAIILGLRAEASAAIFRVLSLGGGFGTAVQADVDANNVELQNEGNISGSFFGFTGGRSGFYNKQWNPCDSFLGGREVRGTRVDPMTYDFGAYGVVGLNYGTSWSW